MPSDTGNINIYDCLRNFSKDLFHIDLKRRLHGNDLYFGIDTSLLQGTRFALAENPYKETFLQRKNVTGTLAR